MSRDSLAATTILTIACGVRHAAKPDEMDDGAAVLGYSASRFHEAVTQSPVVFFGQLALHPGGDI